MRSQIQILEIWGDLACFTRPEMKVERFSYPVITPSAARGILEAIYWKPAFKWQVSRIEILSPPRFIALRRNEVKDKAPSSRIIEQWMEGTKEPEPIWADGNKEMLGTDQKGRTQRQTMALKKIHYRLHAFIRPWPEFDDELVGMEAQFRRRASRGQCVFQPYLGCREFPAYFRLLEPGEPLDPKPYALNQELGWMLYDVFDLSKPGKNDNPPSVSVFQAHIIGGVIEVPLYEDNAVHKTLER
jgi:CRISPR-associated protein Cas5d